MAPPNPAPVITAAKNARYPLTFKVSTLALAISMASYGYAAEAPVPATKSTSSDSRDSDEQLEEWLVMGYRNQPLSSSKMPLTLRETPQSITILTAQSLKDRQVTTLGQALELSAGVTQFSGNGPFAGQPTFGFNQTTIRGIKIDDIYDFRQDGFVSGSYFSQPDLAIFERIEVVKGPNSILYGRGSAGGLINRITKKPQKEARAEIGVSAGSYDTYRADLDVTGPLLAKENLQARLIAAYDDSESFVRGPTTQTTVVAPSVSYQLTEGTRFLLTSLYQDQNIIPNTGLPLARDDGNFKAPDIPRRQYNGVVTEDPYTWKIKSLGGQIDQEINDDWLATLRLNRTKIETPLHSDAYAYRYGGLDGSGDVIVRGNDFDLDRDILSGELQLVGRLDILGHETTMSAGADWNQYDYTRRGAYTASLVGNIYEAIFPLPDADTLTPGFATNSKPESRGAYVQGRIKATDRLAVLLGMRYDDVELDALPYHPQVLPPPPREKDSANEVTGRVGLTYDVNDQMTVYALYSQSFTPELFATDQEGQFLDPETGELYELGLKNEWWQGQLALSAAIYRMDRENIATDVPDSRPPYSISSGLQRSDGAEIELNGQPLPGWNVNLALNYVDSEYKDPNDPLYGSQPGGTADWQAGLFSTYELQSGPLRGLGFGAMYFAIDDRGIGFVPGTIPGYHRVDLYAFYKGFEKTDINLMVRNATDVHYIEGADRPSAIAQFGSPTAMMLTISREI